MHLLVVGADGATGRLIVAHALERGHEVTALARGTVGLPPGNDRLRVLTGDVLDALLLDRAVRGQDVVVSALGSRDRVGRVEIYSAGTRALLDAMARQGVTRILAFSAAGVPAIDTAAVPGFFRWAVVPALARREYADMARMEALLADSDAEWTVLRPLWLRNGPSLGGVRLSAGPFKPVRWGVRRVDLASAVLDVAERHSFVRQGVWVGY